MVCQCILFHFSWIWIHGFFGVPFTSLATNHFDFNAFEIQQNWFLSFDIWSNFGLPIWFENDDFGTCMAVTNLNCKFEKQWTYIGNFSWLIDSQNSCPPIGAFGKISQIYEIVKTFRGDLVSKLPFLTVALTSAGKFSQ